MKSVFILFFLWLSFAMPGVAQETNDSVAKRDSSIVLKEVSPYLNIRDKIFVRNKSPYLIMQVMVALPDSDGGFDPVGSATDISFNEAKEIASYDNNELRSLKGKVLAIKVKGGRDGDSEITYNFDVKFVESHHDLYIDVYSKGDKNKVNIMDF